MIRNIRVVMDKEKKEFGLEYDIEGTEEEKEEDLKFIKKLTEEQMED